MIRELVCPCCGDRWVVLEENIKRAVRRLPPDVHYALDISDVDKTIDWTVPVTEDELDNLVAAFGTEDDS